MCKWLSRLLTLGVIVQYSVLAAPAFGQQPPNLPTQAANPPDNDVWIWVENPTGTLPRIPITVRFWAFRCGGSITAVKPSTTVTGTLTTVTSNIARPDIVAAMASKCSSGIPTNIGYTVTMDLAQLPSGPGYAIDVQVTDDLGRKTMLRQTRGVFTIQ